MKTAPYQRRLVDSAERLWTLSTSLPNAAELSVHLITMKKWIYAGKVETAKTVEPQE